MALSVFVRPDGTATHLYRDGAPTAGLGAAAIRRASRVEPDALNQWWADLAPVGGPALGPYPTRNQALAAEETWLLQQMRNRDSACPASRRA